MKNCFFIKNVLSMMLILSLAFASALPGIGIRAVAENDPDDDLVVSIGSYLVDGKSKYELSIYSDSRTDYGSIYYAPMTVKKGIATIGKWERYGLGASDATLVDINPKIDSYYAIRYDNNIKYVKLCKASNTKWYPVVKYDEKTGEPIVGVSNSKNGTVIPNYNDYINECNSKADVLNTEILKLKEEPNKYYDDCMKGLITWDEYYKMCDECNAKIEELNKKIKEIYSDYDDQYKNVPWKQFSMWYNEDMENYELNQNLYCYVIEKNENIGKIADENVKIKNTDIEIPITIIGTAESKIIKAKIASRPKAPAVKPNYVKGTVTIPKGCSYRVVSSDGGTELVSGNAHYEGCYKQFWDYSSRIREFYNYNDSDASSAAYTLDLNKYGKGTVEIIKKLPNKRASKVRAIPFDMAESSDEDLSFSVNKNTKTAGVSVTIKNSSSDASYEIKNDDKWIKIPAKKKKDKSVTIKGLQPGDKIIVRVMGNAAYELIPGKEYVAYTVSNQDASSDASKDAEE